MIAFCNGTYFYCSDNELRCAFERLHAECGPPRREPNYYAKRLDDVKTGKAIAGPSLARAMKLWDDKNAPGQYLEVDCDSWVKGMRAEIDAIDADDDAAEQEQKNAKKKRKNRENQPVNSPYLNAEESAEYLRITVKALYDLVDKRKLKKLPGSKNYRFTREMLDAYLRGEKP
jgi:excisionase family DNA binding protein